MLVHPVVIPGSGTRSWTVLGDDDVPVVPVDRFLAYLTDIGRSPNTVKAYAHDLKDYWSFLGFRGLDWREARLEDVGEFVRETVTYLQAVYPDGDTLHEEEEQRLLSQLFHAHLVQAHVAARGL